MRFHRVFKCLKSLLLKGSFIISQDPNQRQVRFVISLYLFSEPKCQFLSYQRKNMRNAHMFQTIFWALENRYYKHYFESNLSWKPIKQYSPLMACNGSESVHFVETLWSRNQFFLKKTFPSLISKQQVEQRKKKVKWNNQTMAWCDVTSCRAMMTSRDSGKQLLFNGYNISII